MPTSSLNYLDGRWPLGDETLVDARRLSPEQRLGVSPRGLSSSALRELVRSDGDHLPPTGRLFELAEYLGIPSTSTSTSAEVVKHVQDAIDKGRLVVVRGSTRIGNESERDRAGRNHEAKKSAATTTTTLHGSLSVLVQDTFGVGIPGASIKVDAHGSRVSDASGVTRFDKLPAGPYWLRVSCPNYGPVPQAGAVFSIGEATHAVTVSAAGDSRATVHLASPRVVRLFHSPSSSTNPNRIYKAKPSDTSLRHEVSCEVRCPRVNGSSGPHINVKVRWTFTAASTNAPKQHGGKDQQSIHFSQAASYPAAGSGTTSIDTVTDDAGLTKVVFEASPIAGDRFSIRAEVLRDPADPGRGTIAHASPLALEVWKLLDYTNIYRMNSEGRLGFDVGAACEGRNVQPAFTPAYNEYRAGPLRSCKFVEFMSPLIAPTPTQLPIAEQLTFAGDPRDGREVEVHGIVVDRHGVARLDKEAIRLSYGHARSAHRFQAVTTIVLSSSVGGPIRVGTLAGPVALIPAGVGLHVLQTRFDTVANTGMRAQGWYDANQRALDREFDRYVSQLGTSDPCIVGAGLVHPKHRGQHATAETSYYLAYPEIGVGPHSLHPDGPWEDVDGTNFRNASFLFQNQQAGSYATMVARHEIGHGSDHVSYGPGDHCPRSDCLMHANATNGFFCASRRYHSLRRTMGWNP